MAKKSKSFWAKVGGAIIGFGIGAYLLSQGNMAGLPMLSNAVQVLVGIQDEEEQCMPVPKEHVYVLPTPTDGQ